MQIQNIIEEFPHCLTVKTYSPYAYSQYPMNMQNEELNPKKTEGTEIITSSKMLVLKYLVKLT